MSEYNPYTDGPAEPIGLAMDANGNLPPRSLAAMPRSALEAAYSKLNEARSILADGPTWPPAIERVKHWEEIIHRIESGQTPNEKS
jgi:hypothetical protein